MTAPQPEWRDGVPHCSQMMPVQETTSMTLVSTVLIIAGSREIAAFPRYRGCWDSETTFVVSHIADAVRDFRTAGLGITRVLTGGARGVDRVGEWWARESGLRLDVISPEWDRYGKAAGPRRNKHMAEVAHGFSERGGALVVIRYRDSAGSADMLAKAHTRGLHVVDVLCDRVLEGLPRVIARQVYLRGRAA